MPFKKLLPIGLSLCLILSLVALIRTLQPPVVQRVIHSKVFGAITIAQPLWGAQGLSLIFVDTRKFTPKDLTLPLANKKITAAVIDFRRFVKSANTLGQCLDAPSIAASIKALIQILPTPSVNQLLVTGIADGALIPFLHAQLPVNKTVTNLSIAFSVDLPLDLVLCTPMITQHKGNKHQLLASPALQGGWQSVWTYHPNDKTSLLIRSLSHIETRIADYKTHFDQLLAEEVSKILGQNLKVSLSMPITEVPSFKPRDTVTLFYSGDGGWWDIDKSIAEGMAQQNYPVVGIDVLRYFWERKSPERAASDLATTMAYYRQHWGAKSFVLVGFSFGADILPALYNRLPKQDQDQVKLLTFLSLSKTVDFEIYVSGWVAQGGGDRPIAPELEKLPKQKVLCFYGANEKTETACTSMLDMGATIIEMPGDHHFNKDYPKLTQLILDAIEQHNIH